MIAGRDVWTLAVDDGEPHRVEFSVEMGGGLHDMRFTVHGNLWDRVGERVRIRLAWGDRSAVGEGIVVSAEGGIESASDRTIIYALGKLAMTSDVP